MCPTTCYAHKAATVKKGAMCQHRVPLACSPMPLVYRMILTAPTALEDITVQVMVSVALWLVVGGLWM